MNSDKERPNCLKEEPCGASACRYCGFDKKEHELRIKRGLVFDEDAQRWHMVATKRPKAVRSL